VTIAAVTFNDLYTMAAGKISGHVDVACPECGWHRRAPKNRTRKVLRIWLVDERFATFCCARCGVKGEAHMRRSGGRPVDHDAVRLARAKGAVRDRDTTALQRAKAQWLWRRRLAIPGTVVEIYLRNVRYYSGLIPGTLGYLPARGAHGPAMIAAFGLPIEPEPGVLVMPDDALMGVQLTRLNDRGEKVQGDPKITIGHCLGSPIVVAATNDLLGQAITEGVEDALSIAEATGLGAWAAGGASRLPALAETVPLYTDCISLIVDQNDAGRRHSTELTHRLRARNFNVEVINLNNGARAA
jgi:hypothetical protein